MGRFFGKRQEVPARSAEPLKVQMRRGEAHPFGILDGYVPLGGGGARLYKAIREAVPVVDAAIMKLVRLTGGFTVCCENERVQRELREFIRLVDVGRGQKGLEAFIAGYLDSMITCGCAIGEIVTRGDRDIAAVLCGEVSEIAIEEGETPLDFKLCSAVGGGAPRAFAQQELLMFTPYNPETDSPYGVSMLRSMPFLTDILLKIYSSIGSNFERAGNLRYAVVYRPQGDGLDKAYAKERTEQIARSWSEAMVSGKSGNIRDFVALGDVDIKVIGADNQELSSEVPVRQVLEQLIAKTGIPPFMLGISWSSTERMSAQQADLMTSELAAIRRSLTPVIERICSLWMAMHGYAEAFEILWDDINLQDEVEEAKAGLYRAQTQEIWQRIESGAVGGVGAAV